MIGTPLKEELASSFFLSFGENLDPHQMETGTDHRASGRGQSSVRFVPKADIGVVGSLNEKTPASRRVSYLRG
jgi:hypothetical protein